MFMLSDPCDRVCTMRTYTNLTVTFIDGKTLTLVDVHPNNKYANEGGFVVVEHYCDEVPTVYIPISQIRYFDTQLVSDPYGKVYL